MDAKRPGTVPFESATLVALGRACRIRVFVEEVLHLQL